MAPSKPNSLAKNLSVVVNCGAEAGVLVEVDKRLRRLPSTMGSRSRDMAAVAVRAPRPHRDGDDDGEVHDEEGGGRAGAGAAVVPYSSPEEGFRGYTFEVAEAIKDLRRQHQQREVKGGLMGPLRAAAELERAQEQRNEAFRMWLSGVMKRERELAKRAAFTVLKRRDQMLQEVGPDWFQQLSWDQMQTTNQLQASHRADSEEGSTARMARWCSLLGVTPVPSERQLARALRQQPEDHEAFLLALYSIISKSGKPPAPGDPPAPTLRTGFEYTPSERLLLSALAHLRLPNIIAKLEGEFGPPEKRPRYLRIRPELPPLPAKRERYLWPYLEPLPVPQVDWLEVYSANHTAHTENLYMRAHKLPPTLIEELLPRPLPRVTVPKTTMPTVRRRKRKERKARVDEDLPSGVPPAEQGSAAADDAAGAPSRSAGRRTGRWRSGSRPATRPTTRSVASSPMRAPANADARDTRRRAAGTAADEPTSPGVDPARVVSFLESLAPEEPLCRLPDVHKIPAIHKWVRLRNGLLYVHRRLDGPAGPQPRHVERQPPGHVVPRAHPHARPHSPAGPGADVGPTGLVPPPGGQDHEGVQHGAAQHPGERVTRDVPGHGLRLLPQPGQVPAHVLRVLAQARDGHAGGAAVELGGVQPGRAAQVEGPLLPVQGVAAVT